MLITLTHQGTIHMNQTVDELVAHGIAMQTIDAAISKQKWLKIRADRDQLLANCDYTQMPDTPLTAAQKQDWADYRQALRDLPAANDDPALVVWPTPPQEQ